MADLTKAEMSIRILENLGIKPSGQSANAEDDIRTQEAIDSAHARLDKERKVPFALSAIPDWAQIPLRDYVSFDLMGQFGIVGERAQLILAARREAELQFNKQLASTVKANPTRPFWF